MQVRIGTWIRKWRRSLGWTQARLGDLCGVADHTIGRWETGKLIPHEWDLQTLHALAMLNPGQIKPPILKEMVWDRFLDAMDRRDEVPE